MPQGRQLADKPISIEYGLSTRMKIPGKHEPFKQLGLMIPGNVLGSGFSWLAIPSPSHRQPSNLETITTMIINPLSVSIDTPGSDDLPSHSRLVSFSLRNKMSDK